MVLWPPLHQPGLNRSSVLGRNRRIHDGFICKDVTLVIGHDGAGSEVKSRVSSILRRDSDAVVLLAPVLCRRPGLPEDAEDCLDSQVRGVGV